jgi:hypothetical protein
MTIDIYTTLNGQRRSSCSKVRFIASQDRFVREQHHLDYLAKNPIGAYIVGLKGRADTLHHAVGRDALIWRRRERFALIDPQRARRDAAVAGMRLRAAHDLFRWAARAREMEMAWPGWFSDARYFASSTLFGGS